MSVEVRCPDCGEGWVVEELSGGEMMCPGCMTRIPLDGSSVVATPAVPTEVRVPTVEAVAGPPAEQREEIVCPRCNFHFQPDGRTVVSEDGPRQTVLVVDDLEYFRRIATDALSPSFEVKTAATSDEARQILGEGGIDLMVLDLTLEDGEGGRQLLTHLDPKPCPVLIFTAEDESEMYGDSWEELAQLGADDIVIKGMNVSDVLVRKAGTLLGTPVDEDGAID